MNNLTLTSIKRYLKQCTTLLFLAVGFFTLFASGALASPITPGSFSTTWDTSQDGVDGASPSNQIIFKLGNGGEGGGETCLGTIYWEEVGNDSNNGSSTLESNCFNETITFPSEGNYRVDILGTFPSFRLLNDNHKILTVEQWGDNVWETMHGMFEDTDGLVLNAPDVPDLSVATELSGMFRGATNFNSSLNNWDVSNITHMIGLFQESTSFNQPLNSWDTSSVINMSDMFRGATSFNQDISAWDVSSVTNMGEVFQNATSFNQPLNNWDVSNVTNMSGMLAFNDNFNQPLNNWDVSNVTAFNGVFHGVTAFNQPLNLWNTGSAVTMRDMFENASSFNQDLSSWNVSNVTIMDAMFDGSRLSAENYSNILNSWAQQIVQDDVTLGASGRTYQDNASTSRQFLLDTYNWTINDAGQFVEPTNDTFITRWDTRLGSPTNQLRFYASDRDIGIFTIDWGDGTVQYYATNPNGYLTHTYATPGIKTVTITGTLPVFYAACDEGDAYNKLIDVSQWGTTQWKYLDFNNCTHLTGFSATDVPNLSNVVGMTEMFYNTTSFNDDIGNWDVSSALYMDGMFQNASAFNGDISDWNVSNVQDMSFMFYNATAFNQRLSNWDVSNVGSMTNMLTGTAMSEAKYSTLLTSWSVLPVQAYVNFAIDAKYCNTAQAARDTLTLTNNWIITDGGATSDCVIETDEEESESSDGSSGTRVGERIKSFFYSSTTSPTPMTVTKESFIQSVRNFIEYLTKNEASLDTLTSEERTKVIIGLRDIIAFLLKLIPGV